MDFQKKYNFFAVLQHRDSYTGQSTWFGLEDDHKIQMKSDTDGATESTTVVAKKKKKSRRR